MKHRKLAGWLALAGAILGIVGHYYIFVEWYQPAMHAEAAEPGCEILLKYLMPALTDLGFLAGTLYAVAAYGFFTKARWAYPVVVIANVLALQAAWFVNVPMMAAGLPPIYFTIFWPNLLLFFLFVKLVGETPWSRTLLAFLTGMTYVFCLMNGVASLSRIITIGSPLFVAVQRSHWVAMVGWGVVTVGIILRPAEWQRVVGISAGVLELIVGIPLVIATTMTLGRFSLFSLAPIGSLILLVIFLVPRFWERLSGVPVGPPEAASAPPG